MKKRLSSMLCAGIMALAMVISSVPVFAVTEKAADLVMVDNPLPFADLDASEMIEEMGMGINLGNTLEGHSNQIPGELFWNSVITTQELVTCIHDLGYNTLRVPVTWGKMINDDYSISEEWMSRVQEVVDYAINENMYVILNIHHDGAGGWLRLSGSDEDFAKVEEKFIGVWKTISERFKNYDEHLILESMNEVSGSGSDVDGKNEDLVRLNQLNQDFVDVVRSTGSNNTKRWLDVPTLNTEISTMIDSQYHFRVPTDSAAHIMVAGHIYDPWVTADAVNEQKQGSYAYQFKALKEKYVDQGIPVIIGEFGVLGGKITQAKCEGVAFLAKKYHLTACLWDIDWENSVIDRANLQARNKNLCDAVMRGYFYNTDSGQIAGNTEVIPLTGFSVDTDSVTLQPGRKQRITVSGLAPDNSNDVVLWKSQDSKIASVYNGLITARAVGTTTITAFTQSGTAAKEIIVQVDPLTLDMPSTGIETAADSLEIEVGEEVFLDAMAQPADNDASVTYASADNDIVTVSTIGRVLGKKKGTTSITVTTNDGLSKVIDVTVVPAKIPDGLDNLLAIHVYYNDATNNYFGTEYSKSDVVKVTGAGQYTLSFDCEQDLSDNAKSKGVTTLNGLGSLYIYDYDVTTGKKTKSTSLNGQISYQSIKINGTELLDRDTDAYPAVKSNVIDTNNPLNIWDGSVVTRGIIENKSRYYITFEEENPTKIEITFTLTGFTQTEETASPKPTLSSSPDPVVSTSPDPVVSTSPDPGAIKDPGQNLQTPSPKPSTAPVVTPQVTTSQTKVTSLKAAKKAVSLKKGKTKTIKLSYRTNTGKTLKKGTVKVKIANKKIARVTRTVVKKNQITIKIKALKKKKKTTLRITAGSKIARVIIKTK